MSTLLREIEEFLLTVVTWALAQLKPGNFQGESLGTNFELVSEDPISNRANKDSKTPESR